MRKGLVYRNNQLAGYLCEVSVGNYVFEYDDQYIRNHELPAISLTLPKSQKVHESKHLFPFFFNLLSEGVNRQLQCRQYKIDENDDFGLLLATAKYDTIGAVSVKPAKDGDR